MIEVISEFARIQEMVNAWCDMTKEDKKWMPADFALEKLWMDLEILKAAVFLMLEKSL